MGICSKLNLYISVWCYIELYPLVLSVLHIVNIFGVYHFIKLFSGYVRDVGAYFVREFHVSFSVSAAAYRMSI